MQHPPQSTYGRDARDDVAPYVPTDARSTLEVGCGNGGFGATLRRLLGKDARVVAVEAMPESARLAEQTGDYDRVVEGYFPDAMGEERFDLIVFNDVLEHILDPWQTLRDCHRFLEPGGTVLASIPSIQYFPVVWQLVRRGRWDYVDSGTLDRTHVRFFTRRTMVEMFADAGYAVERVEGIGSLDARWDTDPLAPRRWIKHRLTRLIGDGAYVQFVVVARAR
ncbi:class I SAM-dependent methyltransferase [Nocardioides montaniterrae]